MLALGFAALLGLALGRFFKAAVVVPGVVATTIFAALGEGASGADMSWTLATIALSGACLQLGYLLGVATARPQSRAVRAKIDASSLAPRHPLAQ